MHKTYFKTKTVKKTSSKEDLLWTWFSKYIRLSQANCDGIVKCYTCGTYHHWKNVDAGHYVKREHHATKFDERNVKPQCKKCNRFMGGNQDEFAIHLLKDYGPAIIEELNELKHSYFKFTDQWLDEKLEHYKNEFKKL